MIYNDDSVKEIKVEQLQSFSCIFSGLVAILTLSQLIRVVTKVLGLNFRLASQLSYKLLNTGKKLLFCLLIVSYFQHYFPPAIYNHRNRRSASFNFILTFLRTYTCLTYCRWFLRWTTVCLRFLSKLSIKKVSPQCRLLPTFQVSLNSWMHRWTG